MNKDRLNLGKSGEDAAVEFLKSNGYKILRRNYKSKLGEIDIIARDNDGFAFVEVKARNSDRFGLPEDSVSFHKQRQISKAALWFLKENNLLDKKARFDVVSINYDSGDPSARLIKNAFELDESFTY